MMPDASKPPRSVVPVPGMELALEQVLGQVLVQVGAGAGAGAAHPAATKPVNIMNAIMSDNTFLLISTSFDGMKSYFVACQLNATTPFLIIFYFRNIKITMYNLYVIILTQIVKHIVFILKIFVTCFMTEIIN
jgi:hypothetical protein